LTDVSEFGDIKTSSNCNGATLPRQTEIRRRITNQIIEALKSGNLPPWRKPWALHENVGFPSNVLSKRFCSGINPMLLAIAAQNHASYRSGGGNRLSESLRFTLPV
jgi:antirestriction protein ArdC